MQKVQPLLRRRKIALTDSPLGRFRVLVVWSRDVSLIAAANLRCQLNEVFQFTTRFSQFEDISLRLDHKCASSLVTQVLLFWVSHHAEEGP